MGRKEKGNDQRDADGRVQPLLNMDGVGDGRGVDGTRHAGVSP